MNCPFCNFKEDRVIDSRESKEGDSIRRRRECLQCLRRFTTYERIDEIPYMVVKKDGRREKFERQKVLAGLLKACEKRPVSMSNLADLVDEVEGILSEKTEREITTTEIGEFLMRGIRNIRCVGIAPGYTGTPMLTGMNQDALKSILEDVHIGRLIEPDEIASMIGYCVENGALNGTTIEITGGLCNSKGIAK